MVVGNVVFKKSVIFEAVCRGTSRKYMLKMSLLLSFKNLLNLTKFLVKAQI